MEIGLLEDECIMKPKPCNFCEKTIKMVDWQEH
jgi:hypothetical protein